jgi:GNAT superfamily N-acetyltransferase
LRGGTVVGVSEGIEIAPVSEEQLERLLPMIAAYQGFYEADDIRTERNREFFRRFLAPSENGEIIAAWQGARLVGYACMYWHFSSTRAVETVLMNDLYVDEHERGHGVGRALIEACAQTARQRGAHHLEWSTRPDNTTARRLYDSTGAEPSTWIEYELGV